MIIQNNIAGINSARNKGISEGRMRKSLEKLSSGYRINRAGDDAAGLAISELMRNQISGLNQAIRNVNDGISMTQTGDGSLTEVHSMLERMKTLAVQSANGTYTTLARANLDAEREQLFDELNRISSTSNFDEIPCLMMRKALFLRRLRSRGGLRRRGILTPQTRKVFLRSSLR